MEEIMISMSFQQAWTQLPIAEKDDYAQTKNNSVFATRFCCWDDVSTWPYAPRPLPLLESGDFRDGDEMKPGANTLY